MTPVNNDQKQLLFDYSVGLTIERQTAEAERLLASSEEAASIYGMLKAALEPLNSLEPELCPDDLAERTVLRLKEQAEAISSPVRLDALLAREQGRTTRIRVPFWRNWTELVAAAAAVVLFLGVLLPAFGLTRQKYWQYRCQSNLGDIYGAVSRYRADHNGQLPTVPTTPGSPWWKIGYQGQENYSNTRRLWLLVKQQYALPSQFLCPARRSDRPDSRILNVAAYNDFPSRAYIHFSVRICCPQSREPGLMRKRVLLADLNPLSEQFPEHHASASLDIELCNALMAANSRNHGGRGQNVLLCDGSVEYARKRHTSFSDDDIYTVQAMSCGQRIRGYEVPSSEDDTFVAP